MWFAFDRNIRHFDLSDESLVNGTSHVYQITGEIINLIDTHYIYDFRLNIIINTAYWYVRAACVPDTRKPLQPNGYCLNRRPFQRRWMHLFCVNWLLFTYEIGIIWDTEIPRANKLFITIIWEDRVKIWKETMSWSHRKSRSITYVVGATISANHSSSYKKIPSWTDETGQTNKDVLQLFHKRNTVHVFFLLFLKQTQQDKILITNEPWKWCVGQMIAVRHTI